MVSELMIIGTGVTAIAAVVESYFDANKKSVNHTMSAISRVVGAGAISIATMKGWYPQLVYAAVLLAVYWIVFDPMYNIFRGIDLDYIGSTSWLDKRAKRIFKNGNSYMFFKIWLIFGLLILLHI